MPSVAEVRRVLAQLRTAVQQADETYKLNLSDAASTDASRRADTCPPTTLFDWAFEVVKEQHRKK